MIGGELVRVGDDLLAGFTQFAGQIGTGATAHGGIGNHRVDDVEQLQRGAEARGERDGFMQAMGRSGAAVDGDEDVLVHAFSLVRRNG